LNALRAIGLVAFVAGCGAGGDTGGLPTSAPISGGGTYNKVVGTYILVDTSTDLGDPTVLADGPAGPFTLWLTFGGTEIRRSVLPRLGVDASPPAPALVATEAWEGGRVAAPSVERSASGYQMVYEAGIDILATASSDDGTTWTGKTPLGPHGHNPSLAAGALYYDAEGEIWLQDTPTPLLPGTAPEVRVVDAAGRKVWKMVFNCPGHDTPTAICYAGSYDGVHFETTEVPILQPEAPDEFGPTLALGDAQAVLFFGQQPTGLHVRIGAATSP
jgi:hypothetical protein